MLFNLSLRDTTKRQAALALSTLHAVSAEIVGINVTKASADKHDTESRYYYYGYHGYYGSHSEKERRTHTDGGDGRG